MLNTKNRFYAQEVLKYTKGALESDLYPNGDITTKALNIGSQKIEAKLIAKSSGILAGMEELSFFLKHFPSIKLKILKKDGSKLKKNEIIAKLQGTAGDIFKIERTALNLLQRMSGIATLTAKYIQKAGRKVKIAATRKTVWGLLDKKACWVGGGLTHRFNLSDAILVKDTHLKVMKNNLEQVFKKLNSKSLKGRFIEIEVEKFDQVLKVAKLYQKFIQKNKQVPFHLMLDNIKPPMIKKIIQFLKRQNLYKKIILEASGRINLKNIKQYSKTGVEIVSIGALTHSAPALDISLKVEKILD